MGSRALTKRFLLAVVAMLCFIAAGSAQQDFDWVMAHNLERQFVPGTLLRWDSALAIYASLRGQHLALSNNCATDNSDGPYGENVFRGTGYSFPSDVVRSWVAEKQYYNYASNSCASGQVCGNYTQVVWKSTSLVGCVEVPCRYGDSLVVCCYNLPGNIAGQRPY